jgi:hypothetical protein
VHLCKVRVLLADDHHEVIARVCDTLGEEFELVGTAENGNQAVSAALMLDPDVTRSCGYSSHGSHDPCPLPRLRLDREDPVDQMYSFLHTQ